MTKDDDAIIVPKKSKATATSTGRPSSPSPPMRRLMRITSGIGIALGGFVTLVGLMAMVGVITDNLWVRLLLGLVVVIGLPGFLSDRLLKRTSATLATRGSLGRVADVFAIVLLGIALVFVSAEALTKNLLAREGDRHARSGSTLMARAAYLIAGVSPTFPDEAPTGKPAGSVSGSASTPASTPAAPSAAPSSR